MNRTRTSITVLVVLVLFFALAGEAWALPLLPATFSGTVRLNGAAPGGGVNVTASIGSLSWSTTTFQAAGDTWYQIDVDGDDPNTPVKEGGEEGDTVTFRVGGYNASPNGSWHSGVDSYSHNLSASSPPTPTPITPTSTPTKTPTPTNTPVPADQYWFSGYVYDDDSGGQARSGRSSTPRPLATEVSSGSGPLRGRANTPWSRSTPRVTSQPEPRLRRAPTVRWSILIVSSSTILPSGSSAHRSSTMLSRRSSQRPARQAAQRPRGQQRPSPSRRP